MSINWKKSAELNNCSVEDLKARFERFPRSHKNVIAMCNNPECGRERTIRFGEYRDLCSSCAHMGHEVSEEVREKMQQSTLKQYAAMDDPGEQICIHHYIYDFNDLEKYTIPVTRKDHTIIHNNLRYAGLQVPCINIKKEE